MADPLRFSILVNITCLETVGNFGLRAGVCSEVLWQNVFQHPKKKKKIISVNMVIIILNIYKSVFFFFLLVPIPGDLPLMSLSPNGAKCVTPGF